ncbi:SUF system NifU family Fe-S cluster assembly protein [Arthrobacter zhangbolii]|uniref:SUF system NifU family Fe-S cluster assembly protein n=1 Tax=Arthrobacter zhangbolii TaxID=2886936 RepID=A0A9X1M8J0_9MICC|nr:MULTISPECIES: SUF system NifU family Fe-S cluster assembly protein [Arthrobacter]MCC3272971.1 SUF system NifU family Fe-S cluster assembly protein [Arthrobacter zhangbolii]MDN3905255.1 SUF system NifU family Fe-S cluster assembly protein [Arthrobacter sp. YD2]UON93020.1 SUF system NifU family Fe-S cluster assembly protein [Arthrobacter zhangbolii]
MSSDLQQLYQQIILEHAKRRHGDGLVNTPAGGTAGESHQLNPTCGDEITLRAVLDGSTVAGISWEGQGCSISMASASVLTEMMGGLDRVRALALAEEFRTLMRSRGSIEPDEEVLGDAAAFAGVARYPARVKCAMLAWVAFEEALQAAG